MHATLKSLYFQEFSLHSIHSQRVWHKFPLPVDALCQQAEGRLGFLNPCDAGALLQVDSTPREAWYGPLQAELRERSARNTAKPTSQKILENMHTFFLGHENNMAKDVQASVFLDMSDTASVSEDS